MLYNNITELVGKTPILKTNNFSKKEKINPFYAKLEAFNPAGSIKDRIALKMIEDAEKDGKLKVGDKIVEPTSGNTGIGIAAIGASKGYKVILTMPESMSIERRSIVLAYGAELVLTPASAGMNGAISKAKELAEELNAFMPSQFENLSNPKAHYENTAREIWEDLDGKVDIFIAGIGTGGTISGVGKFLKEKNKDIKIFGIEPMDSPIITKGKSGAHKIQGIGAGFIPKTLDAKVYDEIFLVDNIEAMKASSIFATTEGVLVGISSGAVLAVAKKVISRDEYKNKNIVVVLPDTGERYLSTELYNLPDSQ
ncbi:MAG: cysteine synthase A [Lachnospirales bacterium]